MRRSLVHLVVGHLHGSDSWDEEFEVDHEDPLDPKLEVLEIIEDYNSVEIERFGKEKAQPRLRKLISCTIVTKKGKDMAGVKSYVDEVRAVMERANDGLDLDGYKDFLSEVEEDASSRFAALPEEEEDEEDPEEDEDDEIEEDEEE